MAHKLTQQTIRTIYRDAYRKGFYTGYGRNSALSDKIIFEQADEWAEEKLGSLKGTITNASDRTK